MSVIDAVELRSERRGTISYLRVLDDQSYPNWESIYADNVRRLYRIMFSKVGNRSDAEDLTSEVFLAALRPLRTSASRPEVRAYLIATARTVLAAYWRKRLGQQVTAIDLEAALEFIQDDPPAPAEARASSQSEAGRRAAKVLGSLPERYRTILELRFLRSMSIREAAAEMGVSLGNAKVLQHRALRRAAEFGQEVDT